MRQPDGQRHGQCGQRHRLGQELACQCRSRTAQYLANAHLARPACRTCRRKVHKIDAGDQQDKKGDGAEDPDVAGIAVSVQFGLQVGVQVDIGQVLQIEQRMLSRFFKIGGGSGKQILDQDAHLVVCHAQELPFERFFVDAFLEQKIGEIIIGITPVGLGVRQVGMLHHGHQHIAMKMGGDGNILKNDCHKFAVLRAPHNQCLPQRGYRRTEIVLRATPGNGGGAGSVEVMRRVAGQHFQGKHLKKTAVGK